MRQILQGRMAKLRQMGELNRANVVVFHVIRCELDIIYSKMLIRRWLKKGSHYR